MLLLPKCKGTIKEKWWAKLTGDVVHLHGGPSKAIAVIRGCGFELLEYPSRSSGWPPMIIFYSEAWRNSYVGIGFQATSDERCCCTVSGTRRRKKSVFHTFLLVPRDGGTADVKQRKHICSWLHLVAVSNYLTFVPSLMKIRQSIRIKTERPSRSHIRTSNILV
jgi:hypothetical protein